MVSKAHINALAAGDRWLDQGANVILIGNPSGGKSHLAAAIGLALVENGFRVLYARTTDLVQWLQVARRGLSLESAIRKLDKYHLLILDDIAYVRKDQAETSALFELISSRYERRSLLIIANQPFGQWGSIFPDQAMTLAAVDRLVHRATIFELNVESYRRRAAVASVEVKRHRGKVAKFATPANTQVNPQLAVGALAALDDLPWQGRPATIAAGARAWMVALACRKPTELGYAEELLTVRRLAEHARKHSREAGHPDLAAVVAPGTVSKILAGQEVRPHKITYYLERRDPALDEKMAQVLCFYREMALMRERGAAPDTPLLGYISYDEKPGIQAIGSTAPDRPPVPGEHAAGGRHGTVTLMAAWTWSPDTSIARSWIGIAAGSSSSSCAPSTRPIPRA